MVIALSIVVAWISITGLSAIALTGLGRAPLDRDAEFDLGAASFEGDPYRAYTHLQRTFAPVGGRAR